MPTLKVRKAAVFAERLQFVEPMYARSAQALPEGKDWLYEVKLDGYRCLAGRDAMGVTLWSRRGNVFTDQFLHIAKMCEQLPPDTLLDGELVALGRNGQVSFNLLQRRRSVAQALLFFAFDVIVHRGRSLLKVPLQERREILGDLVSGLNSQPPVICLSEILDVSPTE